MELKRVVQGHRAKDSRTQGQGKEYNSGYKAAGKPPEVLEKTRKLKKMQKCCSGSMPQSVSGTAAAEASSITSRGGCLLLEIQQGIHSAPGDSPRPVGQSPPWICWQTPSRPDMQ